MLEGGERGWWADRVGEGGPNAHQSAAPPPPPPPQRLCGAAPPPRPEDQSPPFTPSVSEGAPQLCREHAEGFLHSGRFAESWPPLGHPVTATVTDIVVCAGKAVPGSGSPIRTARRRSSAHNSHWGRTPGKPTRGGGHLASPVPCPSFLCSGWGQRSHGDRPRGSAPVFVLHGWVTLTDAGPSKNATASLRPPQASEESALITYQGQNPS